MKNIKESALLSFLVLATLFVVGLIMVKPKNIPTSKNLPKNSAEKPLNTSFEIGITNNSDGTMGPATWQDNFSNSLPSSVKGNLSFYITDPPSDEPPGLKKKNFDFTNPSPTLTLSETPAFTTITAVPTVTPHPPGKKAKLTALILNVNKVEVHKAATGSGTISPAVDLGRWETLDIGFVPQTVDLMELAKNKSSTLFGTTELEAGHYTEIRLYITSAEAGYDDGGKVSLRVLGKDKIIRVVRQFTIGVEKETKLTLDVNAQKSVVRAGNQYILKPVVAKMIIE